jgi:hypothetical protein
MRGRIEREIKARSEVRGRVPFRTKCSVLRFALGVCAILRTILGGPRPPLRATPGNLQQINRLNFPTGGSVHPYTRTPPCGGARGANHGYDASVIYNIGHQRGDVKRSLLVSQEKIKSLRRICQDYVLEQSSLEMAFFQF